MEITVFMEFAATCTFQAGIKANVNQSYTKRKLKMNVICAVIVAEVLTFQPNAFSC